MTIEIGSKVQSVNSRLGLMGKGGDKGNGDTTIIGVVKDFVMIPGQGEFVEVYWSTIDETTLHYGDDLRAIVSVEEVRLVKQITYKEYLDFLKRYPGLNANGYYHAEPKCHSIRSSSWQQKFIDEWQYFRSISDSEEGFKQFLIVLAWFEKYQIPKTKHCVSQSHSYHLKHVVEEEFGCYIYNGSFITGALFCGCTMSTRKSVLNPSFNLKYSCIKKTKGWLKQHNLL